MSEPKKFLTRWSERKLNPETTPSAPEAGEPAPSLTEKPATAASAAEPEFDISSLPSLESITEHSDVRAFLQHGVPAELTRAALRRAWSADPAIRDFVGLSENSWDFNAPDSIPGFASSLSANDVREIAAQLLDDAAKETNGPPLPESSGESAKIPAEAEERGELESKTDSSAAVQPSADVAVQHDETLASINSPRQTRRHGGALPE